ncbi:MAG: hypothetical protein E3J78_07050 [Candidatus Cloacimonadota bacterium]|nr:MAG: hypothetical protein E3J78_07050 [Candidatus Cloacimonadota bacterium]
MIEIRMQMRQPEVTVRRSRVAAPMTNKVLNGKFQITLYSITVAVLLVAGCGGKSEVVEKRTERPHFVYDRYIHGINPKKITVYLYGDGYTYIKTDDYSTGESAKVHAAYIPTDEITALAKFFLHEDFLGVAPLSIPAIYGGEVITITFNQEGKSNTIKFLKGTKIPFSVEKCLNKLESTIELFLDE